MRYLNSEDQKENAHIALATGGSVVAASLACSALLQVMEAMFLPLELTMTFLEA